MKIVTLKNSISLKVIIQKSFNNPITINQKYKNCSFPTVLKIQLQLQCFALKAKLMEHLSAADDETKLKDLFMPC
jgi:hypothetical protein